MTQAESAEKKAFQQAAAIAEDALKMYLNAEQEYDAQVAAWAAAHQAGDDEQADRIRKVLEENRYALDRLQRRVELAERTRNAAIDHHMWGLGQETALTASTVSATIAQESVRVAREAKRAAWATFWVALFAMIASTTATMVAAFIT